MTDQIDQTRKVAAGEENRGHRWIDRWPVLIPFVLVGGLLFVSLWIIEHLRFRNQLFERAAQARFEAPVWEWANPYVGDMRHLLGSPTTLRLSDQVTAEELELIGGFSDLTSLSCTGLTDRDLQSLEHLSKLTGLSLGMSSISDAGLTTLISFPELRGLSIQTSEPLSPQGMLPIGTLKHLHRLSISTSGGGTVGLQYLEDLDRLQNLQLSGFDLAGNDLAVLRRLPVLQSVALTNCRIPLDALDSLPGFAGLWELTLNDSTITDEHLARLLLPPSLKYVRCFNTRVTSAACETFASTHPGVMIYDSDSTSYYVDPKSVQAE